MPKVSVIITVYNRRQYIIETIESILAQTYKDFEIIVVDDGSTMDIARFLKPYEDKIIYVYQENRGIGAARNKGIEYAQGEYIAFVDDDDIWFPEKLEIQVPILDHDKELGFVCSEVFSMDEQGNVLARWRKYGDWEQKDTFDDLYEGNFVHCPTVVARRKCLDYIGGFDEGLKTTEDYDCWLRLAKKFKFFYINQPLAKYRLHSTQVSKNPQMYDLQIKNNIKVLTRDVLAGDMSLLKKQIRKAKVYYQYARKFFNAQCYFKAGINYLKAVFTYPLIGRYYWPKESRSMRHSIFYRILKIYYLVIYCWLKGVIATGKKFTVIARNEETNQSF